GTSGTPYPELSFSATMSTRNLHDLANIFRPAQRYGVEHVSFYDEDPEVPKRSRSSAPIRCGRGAASRHRRSAGMTDDRARARIAAVRDAIAANPFLRSPLATASRPPVDVIVPIHDAFDDTVDCLASVAAKPDEPFRLALLTDGSRDP